MSFRYEVSVIISLLLISIMVLDYLYLLIVIFIVMVKVFINHTNDVTTPRNDTPATVVFITMAKTFMIKAYIHKCIWLWENPPLTHKDKY